MRTDINDYPPVSPLHSRRSFLQTTLGGALALGLIGCDQVEDGLETYTGPEISEVDFISFNSQYYDTSIDPTTLFPHNAIVNGNLSGVTDPVAIAYRLQFLIDSNDAASIETILDGLLKAQDNSITFIKYRGFVPTLEFAANEDGFQRSSPEFDIAENAVLSARVAMAANAFPGTAIETKALNFLTAQKEGYNFYLAGGDAMLFPTNGNALEDTVGGPQINFLFNGYYAELAFVLSYFIGNSTTIEDPQVGLDAWQALSTGSAAPTAQHGDSFTDLIQVAVPLAKNGGAHQYFQSLLALPQASVSADLANALYNVLYSLLDASRFASLPGVYSGGPNAQGFFLEDNGLSRLAAAGSQSTVVSIDALAIASRLFAEESTSRQTIRRWIGTYDAVTGVRASNGLYGSVDKDDIVSEAQYARQNGAMILMNSTAGDHLENFLIANGKTSLADMIAGLSFAVEGAQILRLDEPLPLPPQREITAETV